VNSNWLQWISNVAFFLVSALIFRFFRRIAPPRSRLKDWKYETQQAPEPLPTGVVGGAMWALAIGFALAFFPLRAANRSCASLDGPAILTVYAPQSLWCFLPLFGALAVPWPVTVWWLRRVGRKDEADGIEDDADRKGGADCFRLMKWMSIGLVGPIAFFTILAIPIHLSIGESEARLGHYAALHSERFLFSEAQRATVIDGYRLRDGTFRAARDIVIDFSDGRRLSGNAVGDGGTNVRDDVVQLLLAKTGLHPEHAQTVQDIPPR
jgi:hypothetical protein